MSCEAPCLLTTKDYIILEVSLNRAIARGDSLVPMIRRKLARAVVVFPQDIPSHVVTIGSRILYRLGEGEVEAGIVVEGGEDEVAGMRLPITTPRGLALLGMSAGEGAAFQRPAQGLALLGMATGDGATYQRSDGSEERIYVDEIAYQPEAAQRQGPNSNVVSISQDETARTRFPTVINLSAQRKLRQA